MNTALVSAVEARDDVCNLIPACQRVNNLLSERVLVVIVDKKVRSQSVAQERVIILKYNLNCVFCVFLEVPRRHENVLLAVLDLLRLQFLAVHFYEFDASSAEIEFNRG